MTEPTALTKKACKEILQECRSRKPYHHPACPCASPFAQIPSVRAVCKCDGVTEEEFKAERSRIGRIGFKSAGAKRER